MSTEAELCARFRTAAEGDGWIVHPEVGGWDLVLVWPEGCTAPHRIDVKPGDRVAIEAKRHAGVAVLAQAAGRRAERGRGEPNFRAVLVPNAGEPFRAVAARLELGVYTRRHCGLWATNRGAWLRDRIPIYPPHIRRESKTQMWVPPVVSAAPAGVPCPSPMSPWRVQAIKLCARLRERGEVSGRDFDELGISRTVWLAKWLQRDGFGTDGRARYILRDGAELPDTGFEADREAILATGAGA